MTQTTRKQQVENMIFAGLQNLFKSQEVFNLEQFSILTLEAIMLLERNEYLESEQGKGDIGNGTYVRSFKCLKTNAFQVNIPRTRNGEFKPIALELIKKGKEEINTLSLLLYRKGLSTRDIESVLNTYFGESMSSASISNLAKSFHDIRLKWETSKLDAYYKALFCDALYVAVRRGDSYSKEAVYVAYGVKEDNTRELVLLASNPTEGSTMWMNYFRNLKNTRGVEEIDLIVADGLTGFADAAKTIYPYADIQRCVVHLQRNLLNKVRPKEKQEFASDLKEVFNNFDKYDTIGNAMKKIDDFVGKWEASYANVKNLNSIDYISDYLTYIKYPTIIRKMIYTTNSIENLNRQIRKVTKTKVSFESESSMLDLIFMVIKDFEATNWQKFPVPAYQGWPSKNTIN